MQKNCVIRKISLPIQLLLVIGGVLLFGAYVPEPVIRFFYTFSLLFKEFLSFFLPFMIFSFVLTGILSFKKRAPVVLAVLGALIFFSNVIISFISYGFACLLLPAITQNLNMHQIVIEKTLEPFFQYSLSLPLAPEKVLLAAIFIGIFMSFVSMPWVERQIFHVKHGVGCILKRIFIPLLPLYVLGFLLKIQYEEIFVSLFHYYGKAAFLIIAIHAVYLFCYYVVATGFSVKRGIKAIKNAIPSYLTAFSTMSSTAAIPITIEAAEKNTHNKPLAQISMPIMANVHLSGDGVNTPILAMVTMAIFLGYIPTLSHYARFVFYFCTTMFAVSGIPGGGIIIMIPILVSQLGFTPDMVSIITALYLLLDSFGTAANVMGDGALVIIVQRVLKKLKVI